MTKAITETQLACARENRLRAITDRLVRSHDFVGGGENRMDRLQAAYKLAQEIDAVLTWAW